MKNRSLSGLLALSVGLGLAGCGGGGAQSSAPLPSGETSGTGSLTLSMRVSSTGNGPSSVWVPRIQHDSLLLQATSTVIVHVEDPGTGQDVVAPTTIDVNDQTAANGTVSQTISNLPAGTVTVVADAFNGAGDEIGSGSANATVVAGAASSVTVHLEPIGGINTLLAGGNGGPDLSLFVLSPELTPALGFTPPSLGSGTPVAMASATIEFESFGPQFFGGDDLWWVATSANQVVPISVAPSGVATALAPVTLPAPITAIDATATQLGQPMLYVSTSATSDNLQAFPINSDGSLGTPLAPGTIGSTGNTPVGILVLFDEAEDDATFLHLITNGDSVQNLISMPLDSNGNFETGLAVSTTVTGSPVAITFPVGQNPALYVATNEASEAVQAFSIQADTTLVLANSAALSNPATGATVFTLGSGSNLLYATTDGTSSNVVPINLNSDGSLGTSLAAATAGGAGNTPVAVSADFTGQQPFVFVGTNGSGPNVDQFPLDSSGNLGTVFTATAGPNLTSLSGL